ncbi:hypothetical protein BC940DRAFT_311711 [Gongronella butleri]|nr:hypothetical protein BC940DRAFT_311711 [Gongronella butleri]
MMNPSSHVAMDAWVPHMSASMSSSSDSDHDTWAVQSSFGQEYPSQEKCQGYPHPAPVAHHMTTPTTTTTITTTDRSGRISMMVAPQPQQQQQQPQNSRWPPTNHQNHLAPPPHHGGGGNGDSGGESGGNSPLPFLYNGNGLPALVPQQQILQQPPQQQQQQQHRPQPKLSRQGTSDAHAGNYTWLVFKDECWQPFDFVNQSKLEHTLSVDGTFVDITDSHFPRVKRVRVFPRSNYLSYLGVKYRLSRIMQPNAWGDD